MTEPNIGPPRDTMAAEDCEFALRLYLMNQPGWPPYGRGGPNHAREIVVWPTLKSYQWMKDLENHDEKPQANSMRLSSSGKPLDDEQHDFLLSLIKKERACHKLAPFEIRGFKVAMLVRRGLAEWVRPDNHPFLTPIAIRITPAGREYIARHEERLKSST